MAAFALRQLSIDGYQDLLGRVRVLQVDSLSLIRGGYTAGSTTSETSCEAVRFACNILVDRQRPLKDRLQEQLGSITWDTLIAQGLNPAVDLGQKVPLCKELGFFMQEEYLSNLDRLVIFDGTWTYKVPTVDTIPKKFNVEILNSGRHQKCVLSSKGVLNSSATSRAKLISQLYTIHVTCGTPDVLLSLSSNSLKGVTQLSYVNMHCLTTCSWLRELADTRPSGIYGLELEIFLAL